MKMKPVANFFQAIKSFITSITGRISWSSPPWFDYASQRAKARPGLFASLGLAIVLLIALGIYGYSWYQNLPRPTLVTAHITPPSEAPVEDEEAVPSELIIDFGMEKQDGFLKQSVAPLSMIGKDVTEGITFTPKFQGIWRWDSGSRLVFTPDKEWPADQPYTIRFNQSVFAHQVKLESLSYTFTTQPFKADITEFKFYEHPDNPQDRQAVATIKFNYPVNPGSLESKIDLQYQALSGYSSEKMKWKVNYNENKRIAYLHSESLKLPEVERFLEVTVDKGVKSATGSATLESASKTVLIPDAGSYFKITTTEATLIRNDKDRPEQVLTIETTLGVTDAELNRSLHVYLLPKDYPPTNSEEAQTDYQWENPGEVTPAILKLATPVELKSIPADRDYANLHSYKFVVPSSQYLYLKIDKGMRSSGDYVLANPYENVIKVPDYPKEISFLHKGALLALTGEKKLSVVVRGLPAVKFDFARVLPENVNQLITQSNGSFKNLEFINTSFNQQNISEIFSEIRPFNSSDAAKEEYTVLEIGKYLASQTNPSGPLGLFYLQARGWDVNKKTPLDTQTTRLILVTDLGLVVKDNSDGTHDVFVASFTKGEPVANAKVAILGKNGLPILTRMTDAQGRANFPKLSDFVDDREPTVYIASLGSDVSFIPYSNAERQLNYSKFDVGGQYTNPDLQSLSAYIFSDRGIYRPGDTAHIGMIVKQAYVQPQPPGLPLEAIVTDPRGVTVLHQRFVLDDTGYLSFDFNTNAVSPTGQYNVSLYIVKDNQASSLLGSTTIKVSEFLPDRMRIKSHFSEDQATGWVSPVGLKGEIGLWNLYGAPAADRKVSAKIILSPQKIHFKEYPDYIFADPLFDPKKPPKVLTDTLADGRTNDKGEAELQLNLERFDKATYRLTFFAEGFEAEGGRSVATQSTALISPLPYFVGYKSDGDLNYIKQNSQRSVSLIAVNPQLKQLAVSDLKVQLIAQQPVTTLVKNPDGTYQYQSLIQSKVLSTQPFSIPEKGMQYVLSTQQIGDFAVAILDKENTELCRFQFSVVGSGNVALAKNAELSIKLNKQEYQADENIELQITSPYAGSGLITIERDKVYATQWFKTSSTNSVQTIHIPKDFQGNGYINVAFIRDWDSPEIFMNPLSYSVIPFTVNHSQHAIHIDLKTPDLARPGEPFTITYQTDKPGKIIVYAVDEGILQVGNYQTPDPLNFFFDKHALEVSTQQTIDLILPKFMADREWSTVGGDGGEAALRSNLNPFKRKTDLPVVYWSGIINTDTTPQQLIYSIPDYFNGALRVMAVAVSTDAVGVASKTSEIRGHFVINPNVPLFVTPGDEFEITASVANNVKESGENASISVHLDVTPELELIGAGDQKLAITEGQEKTVHYKLRAKALLGSATAILTANYKDKSSKMAATLSVRPANPYLTTLLSGTLNDKNKVFKLDRKLYPEYRKVEAAISTSPLILVAGMQRYLDNFPFGCTEQLVSKAFPLLVMANQPWFANDTATINTKIQATIQMIRQRQMSSGGISYWPGIGENENNSFASVYAMHFLTEAKKQGIDVPHDMLSAGLGYLKELATQSVSNLDEARVQAYAIYILTRNEIVTTNYLTHLQIYLDKELAKEWKSDITSAYIAATYQLLNSYAEAGKIIKYYKPQQKSTDMYHFYNADIGDALYLYLLSRHFPDQLSSLGDGLVLPLVSSMNNDEINTVLCSYTSLALSAYSQARQLSSGLGITVSESSADGKEKTITAQDSYYQVISADESATQLQFSNPNKLRYFYQLIQSGFDKELPTDVLKQGVEIFREYREAKGSTVSTVSLGHEIEVHIQVRSLSDNYLYNMAIVDLLPGGFEVVPDSTHLDNLFSQGIDYADIREDRVIFFLSITPDAKEIVYRIKATNVGKYVIPPILVNSMYNSNIRARGLGGSITIN